MSIRRLVVVILLAAFAPLAAAHACACAWGTTQDALRSADAVFLGTPIGFRPSLLEPTRSEVTRFRVARTWKGDVGTEVAVVSGFHSSCDIEFPDDGRWFVVFANRDRWGRLTVWGCSGTALVGETPWIHLDFVDPEMPDSIPDPGHRTLAELGPGSIPVGPPAADPWPELVAWAAIVAVVMATWGLVRLRQRRSNALA